MAREIRHSYQDPLESLWLECARRVGLRVVRGPESYASTDGRGTLTLTDPSGFDADDCLAQMILHELCHALVQGPESFGWADWGLENETGADAVLEEACLRVQAALLDEFGLRAVLAPTTDYRAFYDALPDDPFAERVPEDRASVIFARLAWHRRETPPWGPHLTEALRATRGLLDAGASFFVDETLLYGSLPALPNRHRLGGLLHPDSTRTCGGCAWAERRPNGALSCVRHRRRVDENERACLEADEELDCERCGACCREAYDVVLVGRRDPALRRVLPQITPTRGGGELPRPDGRCTALTGGERLRAIRPFFGSSTVPEAKPRYAPSEEAPFSCAIYEDRPRTCRDFTVGSRHCLDARRKVGLSR